MNNFHTLVAERGGVGPDTLTEDRVLGFKAWQGAGWPEALDSDQVPGIGRLRT